MKKALIIGGTGQIGVYLANQLLNKNYKVFISPRKITNQKKNKFKKLNYNSKYNSMETLINHFKHYLILLILFIKLPLLFNVVAKLTAVPFPTLFC